jgi:hypothetical protein
MLLLLFHLQITQDPSFQAALKDMFRTSKCMCFFTSFEGLYHVLLTMCTMLLDDLYYLVWRLLTTVFDNVYMCVDDFFNLLTMFYHRFDDCWPCFSYIVTMLFRICCRICCSRTLTICLCIFSYIYTIILKFPNFQSLGTHIITSLFLMADAPVLRDLGESGWLDDHPTVDGQNLAPLH